MKRVYQCLLLVGCGLVLVGCGSEESESGGRINATHKGQ